MKESSQSQLSMEVILEENEPLFTETHLKSENSSSRASLEMMMRAHERIRALEGENEELQQRMMEYEEMRKINNDLFAENQRLREVVREREIKIENLEKLNQKAIIDYVRLERELLLEKTEGRIKRNLTALPNQLNSPLNPIIRHPPQSRPASTSNNTSQQSRDYTANKSKQSTPNKTKKSGENSPACMKQKFKKEERLQFNSSEKKEISNMEFTFDGGLKGSTPPTRSSAKVLQNCFSVNEMSKLVNKVHNRHDSQLNCQKEKLKQFHTFCSSMEKKYSPRASLKKQCPKKCLLNIKQCFSPKNYQFRHSTPYYKELNSTSSSQTGQTGFNIWKSENYNFN